MATAPGRPPPRAFVKAARTSNVLDDFVLRGAGDFFRAAGFRAGDLARGLRGDAVAPAEALAARVATILAAQCLLLKLWRLELGDGTVRSNAKLGSAGARTANAGHAKSPAKELKCTRTKTSARSAFRRCRDVPSSRMNRDEARSGARRLSADLELDDLRGGQAVITVP